MNEPEPENRLENSPPPTENACFKPSEMIACAVCARANPPNRLKCLYCGGALEFTAAQNEPLQPNLRKLEIWENGWNVIFQTVAEPFDAAELPKIAALLKSDGEIVRQVFERGKPLPLARLESEQTADIAGARLRDLSVETFVLSDEALGHETSPRRLRGIEFFGDALQLVAFNGGEIIEVAPEKLKLIVAGAIFERKIQATEEYAKKTDGKILETSETASDERLIDIYFEGDAGGYRIFAKGFDFSTLGARKSMLAKDNLRILVEELRRRAPDARYDGDYAENRRLLAAVWEVEQKTDQRALKREGLRKFNVNSLTTISNLPQFNRYSRLQNNLK